MQPSLKDWLMLIALAFLWGSSYIFIKLALASFEPTSIVAGRLSIAAIFLFFILYLRKLTLKQSTQLWIPFLLIAVIGNAAPYYLIAWGQKSIDTSLTGILLAVMPLTVLVLAHFFLDGERMTRNKIIGFLLGFTGIVILIGPEALLHLGGDLKELISQFAILLAAVFYGIAVIITRRMVDVDSMITATAVCLIAALIMIPIAAVNDQPWQIEPTNLSIIALIILGLFSTAIANIVYFKIIASAGATFLSLMNFMTPVVAVIVGVTFANEILEINTIIALIVILMGIAVSQLPIKFRK